MKIVIFILISHYLLDLVGILKLLLSHLGGWIHSVAFSPCGNKICWVAHNSSICVVDATKGNAVVRLYTEHLPFLSCIWIGSNNIVAAVIGFNFRDHPPGPHRTKTLYLICTGT